LFSASNVSTKEERPVTTFNNRLHLIALLLVFSSLQIGLAQTRRYTVAVLPFEVADSSGRTSEILGETLPNYFEAPIFDSQKFVLLDNSITARVAAAAAEGEAGLTREKVREIGDLYGVDILLSGTITAEQQSSQPYVISTRLIDTSIGEVRSVSLVRVSSDADFQSAAQQIVSQMVSRFPLEGQIYAISGPDIYIDIGITHGLSPLDQTGLIFRQVSVKDKTIREPIGSFSIRQMYQDSSKISVDMVIGYDAKEGDLVTIEVLEGEPLLTRKTLDMPETETMETEAMETEAMETEAATTELANADLAETDASAEIASPTTDKTTNDATVTTTSEEATRDQMTSDQTTGQLNLTSNVSAEVYLDGEYMGVTPLNLEVEAGDYTLELWAQGYETLEQAVTIVAARDLTLEQTLESAGATLTLNLTPPGTVARIDGKLQLQRSFTLPEGDYTLELRHNGYETKTLPLTIKAGEDQTLTEELVAVGQETSSDTNSSDTTNSVAPATLELSVSPAEAVVILDGATSQAGVLSLAPGTHTLTVTLAGYDPFETQLELLPGQTYPLDVLLTASQSSNETANTSEAGTSETSEVSASSSDSSPSDTVLLPALGCEGATTLKSGDFGGETQILFMNQGDESVNTYWISYEGQREFYNVLLPGQEVLQQTALGHVWVVTDVNDECLAVFEPVAEPSRAILE
jgi:hypothetical protein